MDPSIVYPSEILEDRYQASVASNVTPEVEGYEPKTSPRGRPAQSEGPYVGSSPRRRQGLEIPQQQPQQLPRVPLHSGAPVRINVSQAGGLSEDDNMDTTMPGQALTYSLTPRAIASSGQSSCISTPVATPRHGNAFVTIRDPYEAMLLPLIERVVNDYRAVPDIALPQAIAQMRWPRLLEHARELHFANYTRPWGKERELREENAAMMSECEYLARALTEFQEVSVSREVQLQELKLNALSFRDILAAECVAHREAVKGDAERWAERHKHNVANEARVHVQSRELQLQREVQQLRNSLEHQAQAYAAEVRTEVQQTVTAHELRQQEAMAETRAEARHQISILQGEATSQRDLVLRAQRNAADLESRLRESEQQIYGLQVQAANTMSGRQSDANKQVAELRSQLAHALAETSQSQQQHEHMLRRSVALSAEYESSQAELSSLKKTLRKAEASTRSSYPLQSSSFYISAKSSRPLASRAELVPHSELSREQPSHQVMPQSVATSGSQLASQHSHSRQGAPGGGPPNDDDDDADPIPPRPPNNPPHGPPSNPPHGNRDDDDDHGGHGGGQPPPPPPPGWPWPETASPTPFGRGDPPSFSPSSDPQGPPPGGSPGCSGASANIAQLNKAREDLPKLNLPENYQTCSPSRIKEIWEKWVLGVSLAIRTWCDHGLPYWQAQLQIAKTQHGEWVRASVQDKILHETKYLHGLSPLVPNNVSLLEATLSNTIRRKMPTPLESKTLSLGLYQTHEVLFIILKEILPMEDISRISVADDLLRPPSRTISNFTQANKWLDDYIGRFVLAIQTSAFMEPRKLIYHLTEAFASLRQDSTFAVQWMSLYEQANLREADINMSTVLGFAKTLLSIVRQRLRDDQGQLLLATQVGKTTTNSMFKMVDVDDPLYEPEDTSANAATSSDAGTQKPQQKKGTCRFFETENGCFNGDACVYYHPRIPDRCPVCGQKGHGFTQCLRPKGKDAQKQLEQQKQQRAKESGKGKAKGNAADATTSDQKGQKKGKRKGKGKAKSAEADETAAQDEHHDAAADQGETVHASVMLASSSCLDTPSSTSTSNTSTKKDYWTISGTWLVRHHVQSRRKHFNPSWVKPTLNSFLPDGVRVVYMTVLTTGKTFTATNNHYDPDACDADEKLSFSWTGSTWFRIQWRYPLIDAKTMSLESLPPLLSAEGQKPYSLLDSGATHFLLPQSMKPKVAMGTTMSIEITLAVGSKRAEKWLHEVYVTECKTPLTPLGRVLQRLSLTLVWESSSQPSICTRSSNGNMIVLLKPILQGTTMWLSKAQFDLLRQAMWASATSKGAAFTQEQWQERILNGIQPIQCDVIHAASLDVETACHFTPESLTYIESEGSTVASDMRVKQDKTIMSGEINPLDLSKKDLIQHILDFLQHQHYKPRKSALVSKGQDYRTVLFGGYTRQGHGITNQTYQHLDLLDLLHALARTRPSAEPYIALQYNLMEQSDTNSPYMRIHKDAFNEGDSWIIAFGDFSGGRLWIHQAHGTQQAPSACWRSSEDAHLLGQYYDVRNAWIQIPHGALHCVEPTQGQRHSAIYYNPSKSHLLDVKELGELGFLVKDYPSASASSLQLPAMLKPEFDENVADPSFDLPPTSLPSGAEPTSEVYEHHDK
eukprot:6492052-Amphidinium_carterae.1